MKNVIYTLEHTLSKTTKEDLDVIVKSGKRINKVCGVEFERLIYFGYWFVKVELTELLRESKFTEMILLLLNEIGQIKTIEEVSQENHTKLFQFVLWVKDELEAIANIELEYLQSEPDNDLINAGIKELDELGEINTIDNLANGDILKWEQIKKLPYYQVFDKLRKQTLESKINKRYQKILTDKQKRKK